MQSQARQFSIKFFAIFSAGRRPDGWPGRRTGDGWADRRTAGTVTKGAETRILPFFCARRFGAPGPISGPSPGLELEFPVPNPFFACIYRVIPFLVVFEVFGDLRTPF